MNRSVSPSDFRLPDGAHPRICSFLKFWLNACDGGLPNSTDFDVTTLSAEYPLLACIAAVEPEQTLIWRDISAAARWPFGVPVKGRPVQESVPPLSVKRVLSAFRETLVNGTPDYFETTSWMYGGRSLSLARLVAPVMAGAGRELVAVWEILEPPSERTSR